MKKIILLLTALIASMAFIACNDNNGKKPNPDPAPGVTKGYLMSSQVEDVFHLVTFLDFKEGSKVTFGNSITLPVGHLFMERYGDHIFVMSARMFGYGGEQKLYKYQINDDNTIALVGELSFKGTPNVCEIIFASETKAYGVTNGSHGQLVIFNPSTMKETGEIDLSELAKGHIVVKDKDGKPTGEILEDRDPDAGSGIIRDGKLFLTLSQTHSMMDLEKCPGEVVVIDVATDKIEKVISDERVTSLGMLGHTNPFMDEDENIYFYTGPRSSMMSQMMKDKDPYWATSRDGLLRIKKGETEFDKSFHISLQENIEGAELGAYALFMTYYKDKVYFFLAKPSLIVDPNDQTFIKNKNCVPYELDLKSGKGKLLDLPGSTGWSMSASIIVDDIVYFGIQGNDGNGFYSYNTKTGVCSKSPVVSTLSGVYKVLSLK